MMKVFAPTLAHNSSDRFIQVIYIVNSIITSTLSNNL